MDANRFDDLIKRVATTRLTRVGAIRGLAAGAAAALTGMSLSADETDAAKKKGKKRKRKKSICDCTDSTVASCRPMKLKKKKAKKQLRSNRCSYSGLCKGFNPCSPIPTTIVTQTTPGFPIEPGTPGQECTIATNADCAVDFICTSTGNISLTTGVCVRLCPLGVDDCDDGEQCVGVDILGVVVDVCLPLDVGEDCDDGADCSTGSCVADICLFCDALKVCGTGTDLECCVVDADCDPVANVCVLSTD